MRSIPHVRRAAAVALLLVLAGCVDTIPTDPASAPSSPSLAILDGANGGSSDFFFLTPTVDEAPEIDGTFNPDLLPGIRVCLLEGEPGTPCTMDPPVVHFPAGTVPVGPDYYGLLWETDGPETGTFDLDRYYRLEVVLADSVMGWFELDPKDPQQPTPPVAGVYGFYVGETIPVKFWLSTEVLCEGEPFVTECTTSAVIDEAGGTLALEQEGDRLGVVIFEESLPGEGHPPITVTIERIDPVVFLQSTGEECLPLFDAPQFGSCLRIRTTPELTAPLDIPALVSVCLDPALLDGINLPEDQENQLTMVRFADDGSDEWEALPDAAGDCPAIEASLLRVPEAGPFRYAALGINAIASFVGPEPLVARDIRLGALTTSFSRFRYALPGQMIPEEPTVVIQAGDSETIDAVFTVVDHEEIPVENATIHFATIDGTLNAAQAISDSDGRATVEWVVDRSTPGTKTLIASARGLLGDHVPEHSASYFFTVESVEMTATVVGPPALVTVSPEDELVGAAGESAGQVSIGVFDAAGNAVAGAQVEWSGDGSVVGGTTTESDGSATGDWILPTTAGVAEMTATVGDQTGSFTAVVAPGPAALLEATAPTEAPAGSVVPVSISVTDEYGNPRSGDPVTWTVTSGGGSIVGDTEVDQGSASAEWTLGPAAGTNTATASVGGLDVDLVTEGTGCVVGRGTAQVDGEFGSEWECAKQLDFEANVSGGSAPATVYWMNDGERLYFAVRVMRSPVDPKASLRIDLDNDADGYAETGDDVIGFDVRENRVVDGHLSARCARSNGQSDCIAEDVSIDAEGAVGSDGTYTTWELSQPLGGGTPGEDIDVRAGDQLAFFLTLRIGNGAAGNTQFPGFRSYRWFTIVGS